MKFGKLITLAFLLSSVFTYQTNSEPIQSHNYQNKAINQSTALSSDSFDVLKFDFDTEISSESKDFSCTFSDNLSGNDFNFQGNINASVSQLSSGTYRLNIELPDSDGWLEISHYDGDSISKGNLYSSKSDDGIYWISSLSDSSAQRLANTLPGMDVMDNDQIEAEFQETPEVQTRVIANGSISGYLKWTDAQGKTHPLIGAKVKLTMPGSWWAGETYTNSSGFYKISFNGIWTLWAFEPDLHIYAENSMCKITNKDGTVYEKAQHFTDWSDESAYSYSYTFNPNTDGDLGKSMMIFSGLYNYSSYASNLMGGVQIPQCRVIYPTNDTAGSEDKGAYYSNGRNEIHLGYESQRVSGYPNVYASWDTLGHEYGHHLQYHYFNQNYYGTHYVNTNDIFTYFETNGTSDLKAAKDQGIGLAWKESWPTYFEVTAQDTFSDDLKTIETIGDYKYTPYNGADFDLSELIRRGEGDEETIMAFLYRLWDDENSLRFDEISLSDSDIWSVIADKNPKNLSEFVSALYESSLSFSREALGKLLEGFKLSADGLKILVQSENFNSLPQFTWNANGYNVYFQGKNYLYDNDRFDLVFYDQTKKEIVSVTNISGNTYTPSREIWN